MVSADPLCLPFSVPFSFLYFLPALTCPGPSCSCYKSKQGRSTGSTLGPSQAFFYTCSWRAWLQGRPGCREIAVWKIFLVVDRKGGKEELGDTSTGDTSTGLGLD